MGMDTVELAMSFEKYFGLEIPDSVSEKLNAVNDVATWFSQQLGVAGQQQSMVRVMVAEQLMSELPPGITEATPLHQLLPDASTLKSYRYALRNRYRLVLPPLAAPPAFPAPPSLWEIITGRQLPKTPHWHIQTLAELIDWVVAANYEKLLVPPLASQYEVAQAIVGITSYSSGISVEEIRLQSSFTNDLGMD